MRTAELRHSDRSGIPGCALACPSAQASANVNERRGDRVHRLELVFLFDRRTTVITCSIPLVSRLRLAATVCGPVSGQEKAARPGLYYRGAGGWVIRGCYG
jgi:hypothetical protein